MERYEQEKIIEGEPDNLSRLEAKTSAPQGLGEMVEQNEPANGGSNGEDTTRQWLPQHKEQPHATSKHEQTQGAMIQQTDVDDHLVAQIDSQPTGEQPPHLEQMVEFDTKADDSRYSPSILHIFYEE